MRKTFIFGTKLRMYLCELPLIFVLAVAIYFNPGMTNPGKLYPLIFVMAAGIVLMFLYLYRGVSISGERIKSVGLFSSRDSVLVEKNQTLVFTLRPKSMLKIELNSEDDTPAFDWIDRNDPKRIKALNVYRDVAVGGAPKVARVLRDFGVDENDIEKLLMSESAEIETADLVLKKEKSDFGDKYSIHFTNNL